MHKWGRGLGWRQVFCCCCSGFLFVRFGFGFLGEGWEGGNLKSNSQTCISASSFVLFSTLWSFQCCIGLCKC